MLTFQRRADELDDLRVELEDMKDDMFDDLYELMMQEMTMVPRRDMDATSRVPNNSLKKSSLSVPIPQPTLWKDLEQRSSAKPASNKSYPFASRKTSNHLKLGSKLPKDTAGAINFKPFDVRDKLARPFRPVKPPAKNATPSFLHSDTQESTIFSTEEPLGEESDHSVLVTPTGFVCSLESIADVNIGIDEDEGEPSHHSDDHSSDAKVGTGVEYDLLDNESY